MLYIVLGVFVVFGIAVLVWLWAHERRHRAEDLADLTAKRTAQAIINRMRT